VLDLRVPGIIGFSRSKDVLDLTSSTFLPHNVLALAAAESRDDADERGPGAG